MSNEENPQRRLTADQIFKRITWHSAIRVGAPLEQFVTWTVTGVGASAALLISNVDSVSNIVTRGGLQWSLGLLALSLLAGVFCKQIGAIIPVGLANGLELERFLDSEQGQQLISRMTIPLDRLPEELTEPFLWPLSALMRWRMRKPYDRLTNDKMLATFFSAQLWLFWIHALSAVISIVLIALSIGTGTTGDLARMQD